MLHLVWDQIDFAAQPCFELTPEFVIHDPVGSEDKIATRLKSGIKMRTDGKGDVDTAGSKVIS